MSVERDIRFDLIARLCPNTTGAELRSVATEVCDQENKFDLSNVHYNRLVCSQFEHGGRLRRNVISWMPLRRLSDKGRNSLARTCFPYFYLQYTS